MIDQKFMTKITSITIFFCLLWAGMAFAAEAGSSVAILPFKLNAPPDKQYLQEGMRDMLGSRITAETGSVIVPKTKVDAALQAVGGKLVAQNMKSFAQDVGADYLVFGTITALGGGISIDANVFSPSLSDQGVQTFFGAATANEQIMQTIDNIAWDVIEKYFNKKRPASLVAPAQKTEPANGSSAFTTAHPDKTFMTSGGSFSIRGGRNFAKTRNFNMPMTGMDIGDIDGDGKEEVVIANRSEVQIFRRDDTRLNIIETIKMNNRYQIHNVNCSDLNGNGRDEVYISAADPKLPGSRAVEWDGSKFVDLFREARWYIKPMDIPGIGEVLVGQASGLVPVEPGLFQLSFDGKTLQKQERIAVPSDVNLFNFAYADIDGDGKHEVVALNDSFKLMVVKGGEKIWLGQERFAGTKRFLGGEPNMMESTSHNTNDEVDGIGNKYKETYVPSRIIVSDVDHDGLDDIIINRNPATLTSSTPRLIQYPSGTMVGLRWNGLGLEELWRTRKIDGYVIDYNVKSQVMKKDKNEEDELFIGMILNSGTFDSLVGDRSTVLIYPFQFEGADEN